MPVLKHAKKKLRQDKKRTLANKKKKSTFRELIKNAKETPTKEAVSIAFKAIDKAAKANLMHDNKAGRLKSALSKVLNTGAKQAPTTDTKKTTKNPTTSKVTAKKASTKKSPTKSTK